MKNKRREYSKHVMWSTVCGDRPGCVVYQTKMVNLRNEMKSAFVLQYRLDGVYIKTMLMLLLLLLGVFFHRGF